MDELIKLLAGMNSKEQGNLGEFLPLLMKMIGDNDKKKDVVLSTSDLSKILYELRGED